VSVRPVRDVPTAGAPVAPGQSHPETTVAVKLRLRREGTVKRPHYRIVAADSRSPRDGRFIEILGSYHPMEEPSTIRIDAERALHWLRHGAQPTSAVERLLRIEGVWETFKPGDAPKRDRTGHDKVRLTKKARARAAEAAEAAAAAASAPPVEDTAVAEDAPADEPAAAEAPAAEAPAAEPAEAPAAEAPAAEPAEAPADEAPAPAPAEAAEDTEPGA